MARILVIDDDAETRAMLEQVLKTAAHEVVTAEGGKEGLKLFYAQPADLVITDVFMPEQDGVETMIALRRSFAKLPVIAFTGKHAARVMLDVALRLGAVRVLEKPFTPDELLAAVNQALATKAGG